MNAAVGFIGLGNMGGRMTRRIVDAGIPVTGYDVREDVVTDAGAIYVPSIGEVAATSQVILMSLPDSRIIETVVLGDGGLLAHVRPGTVVVDLSSAAPESTRRINGLMAEKGASYLDVGISGGAAAAEKGSLTLMVGGDENALDSIRSVLEPIATNIYLMGDSGAGHVTKLLNNFLNAISLSATAEVMVAGRKAGLNVETLLEVINKSSGMTWASVNRFPKMINGDYLKGGLTSALMLKDITLYLELLGQLGVPSLNGSAPVASFGLANQLGYRDQISNSVVDAIGDVSGGVRIHDGRTDD